MDFSSEQLQRYSRQLLLKEMGGQGQARLLASRVVVVGAGGLGSPAAYYLAAAGVGRLLVIDDDRVELSNLQRQILHTSDRVGEDKAQSAATALRALNPDTEVIPIVSRLHAENVQSILAEGDVIVDGSDNFATRYLLNEACLQAGKVLVSAAVLGFEGQLSTFRHGVDGSAPCYRCLYPELPQSGAQPTCRSAGILGAVAGVLGAWQAAETIKEIVGIGDSLAGSLLLLNLLHGQLLRIQISKNPACPVCGSNV
ncbi:HesA/MoeB/ThiF family protein [Candidatus Magnetaquicoccus inordinatus]|uniref:HesA/MoeB/ThiF family protein n=1 Tax=Candidatus Magnetaquicoccus inordinatus TaxID=2496818 RepID=UPI00102AB28C|nr:molybdopterin-synthase adenylyltransferase MoeB [Candidatus Magnetaquicoccus inordinatus]